MRSGLFTHFWLFHSKALHWVGLGLESFKSRTLVSSCPRLPFFWLASLPGGLKPATPWRREQQHTLCSLEPSTRPQSQCECR